jgi:hypothetical protein
MVAAYMLQQNQSMPIAAADGAVVGLLAGLIGAFITFFLSIPIDMLLEPIQRAMVQRTLEMAGTLPPAIRQLLEDYSQPRTDIGLAGRVVLRIIGLFVLLAVGSVFSTLGGLLGVAFFKKPVPPVVQP